MAIRAIAAIILGLVLTISSIVAFAPLAGAARAQEATFVDTTFTNGHFRMVIGAAEARILALSKDTLLATDLWKLERLGGDEVWNAVPLGPQQDLTQGDTNSTHWVETLQGLADGSVLVIRHEGKPKDGSDAALKITAKLFSPGGGTYRLWWSVAKAVAAAVSIEVRNGSIRTPLLDPIVPSGSAVFYDLTQANSLVFLDNRYNVLHGMNWADAQPFYEGVRVSGKKGGINVDVSLGSHFLQPGETRIIDPKRNTGGGGSGGTTDCYMDVYAAQVTDLSEEWTDGLGRVRVSWLSSVKGTTELYYRFNDGVIGPWYEHKDTSKVTTHSVDLSGLTFGAQWEFQMVSINTDCKLAIDSDVRYLRPERTDLSPNSEGSIERYQADQWYRVSCLLWTEDRKIQYHWKAASPGEFIYGTADRTPYYIATRIEASGEDYCGGNLALRESNIRLYIRDKTDGGTSFFTGVDHFWKLDQIGSAGKITWSANLGAKVGAGQFGIGVTLTPGEGPTLDHTPDANVLDGGWTRIGHFKVSWTGVKTVLLEVLWQVDLLNACALGFCAPNHLYHDMEVRIVFDFLFDGHWAGGWEPFFDDVAVTREIILGNGAPYDVQGGDFDYWFDVLSGTVSLG